MGLGLTRPAPLRLHRETSYPLIASRINSPRLVDRSPVCLAPVYRGMPSPILLARGIPPNLSLPPRLRSQLPGRLRARRFSTLQALPSRQFCPFENRSSAG